MVGITGFVDFDTMHHLGLEGEARFVQFRETADVHFSTYSAGVRYRKNLGRFQPYVKGLLGEGFFNFPYNYATGHYMVVTAGGGIDYRINRKSTSARPMRSGSTGPVHLRRLDQLWRQHWHTIQYSLAGDYTFRSHVILVTATHRWQPLAS